MPEKSESSWIRLSDLMTALMIMFLLISILAIYQIQKREEFKKNLFVEYSESKQKIYEELHGAFKDKFDKWDMVLDKDLSIKFTNPDVLFAYKSPELTPKYKEILDQFIPEYLAIINKSEYKDKIKEVRVEGHTAFDEDYMYSISLSQERSNSVLNYIFNSKSYSDLPDSDKSKLKFWITSNGLGFGRAIDKDGSYVYESNGQISPKSRRVEFRIITSSDALVDSILKEYKLK